MSEINLKVKIDNEETEPLLDIYSIEKILINSLKKLGKSGDFEVEISFVSEAEIERLNKKYRGINKPTDVLSFPQPELKLSYNLLGSIVICGKIANERGEDIEQLLKHGLLHLLGYDHDNDEIGWDIAAEKIDCSF